MMNNDSSASIDGFILDGHQRTGQLTIGSHEVGHNQIFTANISKFADAITAHDPQGVDYPARLIGANVRVRISQPPNGWGLFRPKATIQSIEFLPGRARVTTTCRSCSRKFFTMAASQCRCGRIRNRAFKHCVVCAYVKGVCGACGKAMQTHESDGESDGEDEE